MEQECKICGSLTNRNFSFLSGRIYKCDHCGVEFLVPQLTDEAISQLYSKTYYKAWGIGQGAESSLALMKKNTAGLRLHLIKKYVTTGKLLDVGCATGFFM